MIKITENNKRISGLFLLLVSKYIYAQDNGVEMADALRESGKIYVVVAVLLIIFSGIAIYLLKLDKKISKLEQRINKRKE